MKSPAPAHSSFVDPSGNIFGVKLCTNATIRPYFFGFSFFYSFWMFSFCYSLLFLLFFSISSYSSLLILIFLSLLILLVGAILRLLILLFLYFYCLLYYRHAYKLYTHISYSEGFFEEAKPFLIHLGSKFMYLPVRP